MSKQVSVVTIDTFHVFPCELLIRPKLRIEHPETGYPLRREANTTACEPGVKVSAVLIFFPTDAWDLIRLMPGRGFGG